MAFELMSVGAQPYAEFATLAEVSERVKEGYRLQRPPDCPPAVYDAVLAPCWNADAAARPGFTQLCRELEALGAVRDRDDMDDLDDVEAAKRKSEDATVVFRRVSLRMRRKSQISAELALLGVGVHHLRDVLVPKCTAVHGAATTVSQMVKAVVKPLTASVTCPRDGDLGSAYVDAISAPDAGRAHALLSYTWRYAVSSVAIALER